MMKTYVDAHEYAKWSYFHQMNDIYIMWLLKTSIFVYQYLYWRN